MTGPLVLYGTDGRPLQSSARFTVDDLPSMINSSMWGGLSQTIYGNKEEISGTFVSFANSGFKGNGIVFSCMLARLSLFSQVRFMFQEFRKGIPGDLFSTPELGLLNETPAPGTTLGDLLARVIQDADLAGNNFIVKRPNRLKRLRPDWMTIVLGSTSEPEMDANDVDAEVIGYIYHPNGRYSGQDFEVFLPEEMCHFAPIPDPLAHYRGMSWLTPVIREMQGDIAASDFKTLYYTNGATPNLVVSFDASIKREAFDQWVKAFEEKHVGIANAYKTLYLGAGTTATVIGSNMQSNDFAKVRGADETRIVSASGLHPTIVGTSDSLQGSSLNPGNFTAAARLVADKTFRFLWSNFAGSMQSIITPPKGARLWYDASQVDFLKDDEKDLAAVLQVNATTIEGLIREGYDPDSVVDAVMSGDLRRLKGQHSGMISVQLHSPGEEPAPAPAQLPAPEPAKQIPAKAASIESQAEVRCSGCQKLLAEFASAPYRMTCPRCKAVTSVGLGPDAATIVDTTREDRLAADERAERLVTALVAIASREIPVPVVTIAEGAVRVEVTNTPPAVVAAPDEPERVELQYDPDGNIVAVVTA